MVSSHDEIIAGVDEIQFASDLIKLKPQALRTKYRREASCHANTKRRCKAGAAEFDPAWDNFRDFLREMGPCSIPDGSIDRLDPRLLRYGPGLCRWAGKQAQTANRTNTIWVDFRGERLTLQEYADRLGAPYPTIYSAYRRGETCEAIALRYRPGHQARSYRPARIETEAELAAWYERYERWKKGVRRDRRAFAPPEVFDIVSVSFRLDRAATRLEASDYYEPGLDGSEADQAELTDEQRCIKYGTEWIRHALRSLVKHDWQLAARLFPSNGTRFRSLHLFDGWLTKRDEF